MLLIIHAGLHKTASTFLQAILTQNRDALLAQGLYVQPEAGLGANHSTAWAARLGDYVGIREHLRLATKTRRRRLLLTSEDFESLIFTPQHARGVEDTARAGGATEIEWHFCLRDPGDYFSSLYAQLSRHTYIDFAAMFEAVVREGRLDVASERRAHPDLWSYCFDYETRIRELAESLTGTLVFHDFRDGHPFPGHTVFERFAGTMALNLPPDAAKNLRQLPDEVELRYQRKLANAADRAEVGAETRSFLATRPHVPHDVLSDCAAAVSRLYAPGMERLLGMKTMPGGSRRP